MVHRSTSLSHIPAEWDKGGGCYPDDRRRRTGSIVGSMQADSKGIPSSRIGPAGGRLLRAQAGWPVVVELNLGEAVQVAGQQIRLISIAEQFEPDYWIADNRARRTLAGAAIELAVGGHRAVVTAMPYQLPVTVNGLRLFVETTKNWASDCTIEPIFDVQRDVRISACAEDESWGPLDLVFPIRGYRWRSSTYQNTWSALVPYNLLYYHRGEDFGAVPDRLDVVAMLEGTVVRSPVPGGDGASNELVIRHVSGLEVRYAHMNAATIDRGLAEGVSVIPGQVLGKTGMTWRGHLSQTHDPHLHVDLAFKGTRLSPYPFLAEAYTRAYPDVLLPVAGGYLFSTIGEAVRLDGSRSVARPGRHIEAFRWRLHDGRQIDGPEGTIEYQQAGWYSEELIVEADGGEEDRDYVQVRVYDPDRPQTANEIAYGWVHHTPVRDIKPGTQVTFWNRLRGTKDPVSIDFGDGSAPQVFPPETLHAYRRSGLYTVSVTGRGVNGDPLTVRLRVIVVDDLAKQ